MDEEVAKEEEEDEEEDYKEKEETNEATPSLRDVKPFPSY